MTNNEANDENTENPENLGDTENTEGPANSDDSVEADAAATPVAPAVMLGATLVDELIRAGVREAVVCPGSRSAPLALAFAEAARANRLRLHVRTDERTASFLALGLAKRSRTPVPVVMTSGTAVANCLPAMVEATLSHVPLLILSANRPWSMVGTGANQTIEQREIFGKHAVATLELDAAIDMATAVPATLPDDEASADIEAYEPLVRRTRVTVDRLVAEAMDPINGGGAHLDIPLREPLVPASATQLTLLARELAESGDQPGQSGSSAQSTQPAQSAQPARSYAQASQSARLPYGEVTVDVSKRTLVIAGSVTHYPWAREVLETLADLPVLAEPTSPAPDFPVHPAAAAMFTTGLVSHGEYSALTQPEQIIVVGRPTLHRSVTRLLADPDIDVTVLTDTSPVPDVAGTARQVGSTITLSGEQPEAWLQVCRGVSDLGVESVRGAIEATTKDGKFTGLHVAGVVTDSLRDGDAFVVGASSPIRDVARTGLPFHGVRTIASRGAAGIDGLISTAFGAAMAHASADPTAIRPPRTVALLGDLSFIHDATGLYTGELNPIPGNLVIVIANDDGGAIFESLEPGNDSLRTFDDGTPAFERVFGTPTGANIEALCESAGVDWVGVRSIEELADVLDAQETSDDIPGLVRNDGPTTGSVLVVEAFVDRAARVDIEKQIRSKVTPG